MNELQSAPSDEALAGEAQADEAVTAESLIDAEDLIEEVSIDGMCGVY
ncbi:MULTISPECIES: mycofactocin precursor MftA [unclassified Streptomyces]